MPCLSTPVKVKTITTGETYGADVALMDQVKRKVKLEGTNQDEQCIIVFCPIISRVGSDVEAAMQNVPRDKKIILVLMHHSREADYSTTGIIWSEKYPNIDLEVHVLFHESVPGLLTCFKNTDAVFQMRDYFKRSEINSQCCSFSLSCVLVFVLLFVLLFVFISVVVWCYYTFWS